MKKINLQIKYEIEITVSGQIGERFALQQSDDNAHFRTTHNVVIGDFGSATIKLSKMERYVRAIKL